jgi:hypothetical protein
MDAESAPFDDPTLGGVGDAALIHPVFPNTAEAAHLTLYQAMDGRVQLRWRLDASALAHARDAFGKGLDRPQPVLRLHQLYGDGASRIIADASLDDPDLTLEGHANFQADATDGLLQAEIGLSTTAGGWILVARSNQMQMTTPTGASFLRQPDPPLPAQLDIVADTVAASPDRTLLPGSQPLALQDTDLARARFPLVEPEPGVGTDAMPALVELKHAPPPAHAGSAALQQDGQKNGQPEAQPATQIETQREGQRAAPQPMEFAPGSGPMQAFRADAGAEIGAELLVYGSAMPGTLLDLGGHPYRVGAGGRFSLRVPLADQALIMGLLAMLSELPVACRPGDEQD